MAETPTGLNTRHLNDLLCPECGDPGPHPVVDEEPTGVVIVECGADLGCDPFPAPADAQVRA